MVREFVTIQCGCSHCLLKIIFLIQARLRFHFIVGQASLGRFLLPCSPWLLHWTNAGLQGDGSPRAGGLPNAGACLSCVVRERQQMGWGFPVTVPQCAHRGPNDCCSKFACTTATLVSPPSQTCERERVDLLVSEPHFVLGLWKKLHQQGRDAL